MKKIFLLAAAALVDLSTIQNLDIPSVATDPASKIGIIELTKENATLLSEYNHSNGKCGGFELLDDSEARKFSVIAANIAGINLKNENYSALSFRSFNLQPKIEIEKAISEVSEENLRSWVTYFSNFKSRFHGLSDPNEHVRMLGQAMSLLAKESGIPFEVELVAHQRTKQNSLRIRLIGKEKPNEVIVLGGHFDSINGSGWNPDASAPGADDNASGSANLVEAFRILIKQGQPKRSVEFFWYAAEEIGLVGSAEIARNYKQQNKDIIAVLQLDMTLHPGSGELVISNIGDFTSQWLRDFLIDMNNTYLHVRVVNDDCGYACSDHASWYRQGYPTLMPFESMGDKMNSQIHTTSDKINSQSSFKHSAVFSKIAIIFAMELANSDRRQPY